MAGIRDRATVGGHPPGPDRSQLEQHRHRAVVDELDLHVRAEHAGLHVRAEPAQRVGEGRDQRLGDGTRRGRVPRRPSTLGGIGVERELADDQDRRTDVARRLLVVENA